MMFSATWYAITCSRTFSDPYRPKSVDSLAKQYLDDPISIVVGDGELKANKDVTQYVQVMHPHQRMETLTVR